MIDCLNNLLDLILKIIAIISGILIFFLPLFYRIRLYVEKKRNVKLRSIALNLLLNSEPNWIPDDNLQLSMINESMKPFSFVNVISQELYLKNLFENNEPAENAGLKDCKMIPMYSLNHFVELYNKSLLSGFWSLFIKPVKLLDDNYFKIEIFKDKENENTNMILVIKYDVDYIKIFKFINNI